MAIKYFAGLQVMSIMCFFHSIALSYALVHGERAQVC